MKPSRRLGPVIDKARESEQAAARALGEAHTRVDGAAQKLAELETYRSEYIEGLQHKTRNGLNAMQMKDYRVFLGRLDEARRAKEPLLSQQFPAKVPGYELRILSQPEEQHRARYLTEGSRGSVKNRNGQAFPAVKVSTAECWTGLEFSGY